MTRGQPNLCLNQQTVAAGTEWNPEPDGLLVVRVHAGMGYFLGSQIRHELKPSDVVALGAPASVCFRASQLGKLELQSFPLKPELLTGLLTLAERTFFENTIVQLGEKPRFFGEDHTVAAHYRQLAGQPLQSSFAFRCHMLMLVALLFEREIPPPRDEPPSADASQRFGSLVEKMSEADWQNLRLQELARMCGCSERHFSRLFRRHFGISVRSKQLSLRLKTARRLLQESDAKIINVAMESGFRSLGLFNAMFKRQFGMTPSDWRQQGGRKRRRGALAGVAAALLCWWGVAAQAATTNAPPAQPAFKVDGFEVTGNTLLSPTEMDSVLTNFTGPSVTVEQIIQAQKTLNLLYRRKGYVTVATTLPPQKITNGIVQLAVTEGRLTEINIVGNRYFSAENIRRALPSLTTNLFLQSQWFGPELDRANANSDRQIYPEIVPGPEPGTSALMLKVKDRLPLHGRVEINNLATPGTPDTRINTSVQYNNLWQKEHSTGLQYSFSPFDFRQEAKLPEKFFDAPLVANYSAYYRLPLGTPDPLKRQMELQPAAFGYDEATRQFRLPPATGNPELNFFVSRSSNDTGVKYGRTNTVVSTPLVLIQSVDSGQDLTVNESVGMKLSVPLPEKGGVRSVVSAGLDLKHFYATSFNTNNFVSTVTITNSVGQISTRQDITSSAQPTRINAVTYVPLSLRWDGARPDKQGNNSGFFGLNYHAPIMADEEDFRAVAGNRAKAGYVTMQAGVTREQKLFGDYTVLLRADGQWANSVLISNEQFGLGGAAGVRGYREGEQYGDMGWRVGIEPRTSFREIGFVNTLPTRVRWSAFTDYGELYSADGSRPTLRLWGAGVGLQTLVGDKVDIRFSVAWALYDTPLTVSGRFLAQFAAGFQF